MNVAKKTIISSSLLCEARFRILIKQIFYLIMIILCII